MFKSPLTSLTIKFTLCGDLMGGGFTMWHRRLESTSVWPCSHFWDSWHDKSRSNKNTDIAGVQRKPGDLIRAQPDKDLSGCQRKLVVAVVTWSLDWSYHLSHQSLFLISNLTQSSHLDISSSSALRSVSQHFNKLKLYFTPYSIILRSGTIGPLLLRQGRPQSL